MARLVRRRLTCSTAPPCSSISTAPWSSWPRRPTRSAVPPRLGAAARAAAAAARRPARDRQRPLARRPRAASAARRHRLLRVARARAAARRRHAPAAERRRSGSTTCASEVERFAAGADGLLVEEKPAGIALHYRLAPDAGGARRRASWPRWPASAAWRCSAARWWSSCGPTGATKGDAVRAFMAEPDFAGARPVFVGDDLTDEHAFAAAAALGGARHPGRRRRATTAARYRLPIGRRGRATGSERRA